MQIFFMDICFNKVNIHACYLLDNKFLNRYSAFNYGSDKIQTLCPVLKCRASFYQIE